MSLPEYLTHHLVQDAATAAFLDRLLSLTLDHPAARVARCRMVFAPAVRLGNDRVEHDLSCLPEFGNDQRLHARHRRVCSRNNDPGISPVGLSRVAYWLVLRRYLHCSACAPRASRDTRSRRPKPGCRLRARCRPRSVGPISTGSSLPITRPGAIAATAGCNWNCAAGGRSIRLDSRIEGFTQLAERAALAATAARGGVERRDRGKSGRAWYPHARVSAASSHLAESRV